MRQNRFKTPLNLLPDSSKTTPYLWSIFWALCVIASPAYAQLATTTGKIDSIVNLVRIVAGSIVVGAFVWQGLKALSVFGNFDKTELMGVLFGAVLIVGAVELGAMVMAP